jgi:hypothetical protein
MAFSPALTPRLGMPGLIIVTNNTREFSRMPGIRVDHAVDALDLVDDAGRGGAGKAHVEGAP